MDNNDEKKDLSADDLIKMLNLSLGLTPDGKPKEEEEEEEEEEDNTEKNDTATDLNGDDEIVMIDDGYEEPVSEDAQDDSLTEFDDSLIGFSDTLDRLDDSVYQPAPMSKGTQGRSVSSINLTEEEPREESKVIFDDADFDELDSANAPTSHFSIPDDEKASSEALEVAPVEESEEETDNTIQAVMPSEEDETPADDGETKPIDDTIESDLKQTIERVVATDSDDKKDASPHNEPDPALSENDAKAFDQSYNGEEDSSDGYDDAQHEIMFAVNFEKELNDIFNDDLSQDEEKPDKKEAKRIRKVQAEEKAARRIREYTDPTQKTFFLERYKKRFTMFNVRIIASFVVLVALLLIESLASFGATLPHFIDPVANPRVLILLCMQLFLIVCGLSVNSIASGAKAFVTGRSSADVLTFSFVFFTLAYGIFTVVALPEDPTLMFSPCAFCIFVSVLSEFMDLKREINAFKIVSSTKRKYTVEKYTPDAESIDKNEFYSYLPENPELLKINKTSFINKFATNFAQHSKQRSSFGIIALISISIMIADFILMVILKNTLPSSVGYAFTLLCAILPSSLYIAFSAPLYKASSLAAYENSTFIGEKAADDYASASVVSFDDIEVFPPYATKLVHHRIYPHARFDHVVFVIASLFKKLNGPLNEVFASITNEIGTTDNVKIHTVYEDGIEADVADEHVLIGSASFMENRNYIPAYTAEDEMSEANNSKRIMYVAFGGTIVAKFYFQYTADGDFSNTLRQLTAAGMCIAVKTFDPNIDTALLANDINIKKYPVKVIKCENASELSSVSENAEATIVSKGSVKSLLKTLTNCRRLSSVFKTGTLISVISMLIAVMIIVFAFIAGLGGGITSLMIVIYQLIWVIVAKIVTGMYIK